MKRQVEHLEGEKFDLVVIGGGIFGACVAWDAVLRGMRVAMVERQDFGGQTSANCFKMVHGGIRYMQHADIVRIRESCHERRALLRIAPHLVQPLPIAIPTYGHGMNGKLLLAAGMWGYDLLTCDRNRGIADPGRHVPFGYFLSRDDILRFFPDLHGDGLTGAAVFHDAQMYSPARLVLAFIRSAVDRGVVACNYVEAGDLVVENGRVRGLNCRDLLCGESFTIHADAVINATGGYSESLFRRWFEPDRTGKRTYSRDACFVVDRRFESPMAIALMGQSRDSDAVLAREGRHLFISPWRDASLIGVWHKVHEGDPRDLQVEDREIETFIDEINGTYTGLDIRPDEVRLWHSGLLPFGDARDSGRELSYGKRSIFIDHGREHGIGGLVSVIGIRYTMGRGDAARAVDMLLAGQGKRTHRPATDRIAIHGGEVEVFEDLVTEIHRSDGFPSGGAVARSLAHNHGSAYRGVLAHARNTPAMLQPITGTDVLGVEVLHAIRDEMAVNLADIVFRRTDLATAGHPGDEALRMAAVIAGRELGWNDGKVQEEIDGVMDCFPGFPRSSGRFPSDPLNAELTHEDSVL
ncbi:MAG: glycerol-3-phosphate dehydrogenase/oxidase [Geminicoccaceae bacterium]|nr:glycerol-3-phosphate dehydrogenase/oxidase [Geminicoccaceae bacterium]